MFTGIIQDMGVIEMLARGEVGARIQLRLLRPGDPIRRGESIAINGVCLTALQNEDGSFAADVSPETLAKTNLGHFAPGDAVNIERAMTITDRLGGHLVQGHVDTVGTILGIHPEGSFATYRWSYPREFRTLVVPKGSIAVDGVSLTIVDPDDTSFSAALIPETLERTNMRYSRIGGEVNLEFDVMAKFAYRMLSPYLPKNVP
jgi:riboflavin synthase